MVSGLLLCLVSALFFLCLCAVRASGSCLRILDSPRPHGCVCPVLYPACLLVGRPHPACPPLELCSSLCSICGAELYVCLFYVPVLSCLSCLAFSCALIALMCPMGTGVIGRPFGPVTLMSLQDHPALYPILLHGLLQHRGLRPFIGLSVTAP